eukprot:272725-Alexandrium_andersonii.AAC.1
MHGYPKLAPWTMQSAAARSTPSCTSIRTKAYGCRCAWVFVHWLSSIPEKTPQHANVCLSLHMPATTHHSPHAASPIFKVMQESLDEISNRA